MAGVYYAATSRVQPNLVNLDKPYPKSAVHNLDLDEDLSKFKPGPVSCDGKRVCATGRITSYQPKPEIVAKAPGAVKLSGAE